MGRHKEPTLLDRGIVASLAVLVVGALAYSIYVVVNFDDYMLPVRPTSRPAGVPAEAVWHGARGHKAGEWITCAVTDTEALYLCRTWSDSGHFADSAFYRYAGVGAPPDHIEVESRDWRTVYLRGGEPLQYAGEVPSADPALEARGVHR